MNKILIEWILTNQCNKRCQYCDLNFINRSISFQDIDLFIDFLNNNKAEYNINFFWWEPLLEFEKIKYFVEKTRKIISRFSIWTNGLLLSEDKLQFFEDNNIIVYLSIDNIDSLAKLKLELISKYKKNIIINFINDPDYLDNSIDCFKKIIDFWFQEIAFMPVFSTKKRDINKLSSFKKIYDQIKQNLDWIKFKKYWYFNWISIEKQYVLDTDLYFYSDLDSLLWLQKQYDNTPIELKNKIEDKTKLLSLKQKDISLNNLINLYNIKDILKLVFSIPKSTKDYHIYKIIDKILEKNDSKKR